MNNNECKDCKWFHFSKCRRRAPKLGLRTMAFYDADSGALGPLVQSDKSQAAWPPVSAFDFCGEFEKKKNSHE